jgi:hypothetical protein
MNLAEPFFLLFPPAFKGLTKEFDSNFFRLVPLAGGEIDEMIRGVC